MFGYLYLTEKKVKKELKGILDKFDQRQGWCAKFIKMGSPAEEPAKVQEKCAIYNTYLADIKRKLKQDKIPLKNMRVYVEQLSSLIKQVESISDLPTPDAAPAAEPAMSGYYGQVSTAMRGDEANPFAGYGQVSTAMRGDEVNPFAGYGQVSTAMRGDEVNPFDGFEGFGKGPWRRGGRHGPPRWTRRRKRRRRRRRLSRFCRRHPNSPKCERPGNLEGIFANWDWAS